MLKTQNSELEALVDSTAVVSYIAHPCYLESVTEA